MHVKLERGLDQIPAAAWALRTIPPERGQQRCEIRKVDVAIAVDVALGGQRAGAGPEVRKQDRQVVQRYGEIPVQITRAIQCKRHRRAPRLEVSKRIDGGTDDVAIVAGDCPRLDELVFEKV